MITNAPLPPQLQEATKGTNIDFVIKARRLKPAGEALKLIGFGAFWLAVTGMMATLFFLDLFLGGSIDATVNGVPTTITMESTNLLLMIGGFFGLFILVGLAVFIAGIYQLFAPGGWYIGMPEGLSHYRKGTTELMKWDSFTDDVEFHNDKHGGELILTNENNLKLTILGIGNAEQIAEICKQRIKEAASSS